MAQKYMFTQEAFPRIYEAFMKAKNALHAQNEAIGKLGRPRTLDAIRDYDTRLAVQSIMQDFEEARLALYDVIHEEVQEIDVATEEWQINLDDVYPTLMHKENSLEEEVSARPGDKVLFTYDTLPQTAKSAIDKLAAYQAKHEEERRELRETVQKTQDKLQYLLERRTALANRFWLELYKAKALKQDIEAKLIITEKAVYEVSSKEKLERVIDNLISDIA